MIQEYLFLNNDNKDEINQFNYERVNKRVVDFGDEGAFIVSFSIMGNNEENAERLSKLNETIVSKYNPVILTNDASSYFNKRLYPLFNDFERNLRKVIYITSNYYKVEEAKEVVENLETYVFGDIYDNIFTDEAFVNEVKACVNKASKKNRFSKTEIINAINEYNESTIWEKLVGNSNLKIVSENFLKIKEYRNKVMHSRSINFDEYKKAAQLLKQVNEEIEGEISKYINKDDSLSQIDIAGAIKALILFANALKIIKDEVKPYVEALAPVVVPMVKGYNESKFRNNLIGLPKEQDEDDFVYPSV